MICPAPCSCETFSEAAKASSKVPTLAFAGLVRSIMLRRSMMIFPEDSVAMVLEDAQKGDVIETPRGRVELLEDVE